MKSEYITAIIAILGSLGGVVLGWFLQERSQKKGDIIINVKYKRFQTLATEKNITIYGTDLEFTVYNESSINKIIQDIKLVFFHNDKEIEIPMEQLETTFQDKPSLNDITVPAKSVISVTYGDTEFKIDVNYGSEVLLRLTKSEKLSDIFLCGLYEKEYLDDSKGYPQELLYPPFEAYQIKTTRHKV